MATSAPPASNSDARPADNEFLIPPEDTIWKRYSPHHEAPMSFLGSGAFHVVVLGVVGLLVFLAYVWWNPPRQNLPIDTIRMPGGGGGSPKGKGSGPGIGSGGEDLSADPNQDPSGEALQRPDLDVQEAKQMKFEFKDDPTAQRWIEQGNENLKKIARLNPDARNQLRDGINPGEGRGGTGKGGGKGTGDGPVAGPGKGDGRMLNEREKRMLRWTMVFDTRSGQDYRDQLAGLGAIVAVPTGDGKDYRICDLSKKPYQLVDEDLSKIQRIYWVDDKPQSVRSLLGAIGVTGHASHFVAFMPLELEEELARKELSFKGLAEDQIYETKFKVLRGAGGKYDVKVIDQKRK
jgi:hypothetical protein